MISTVPLKSAEPLHSEFVEAGVNLLYFILLLGIAGIAFLEMFRVENRSHKEYQLWLQRQNVAVEIRIWSHMCTTTLGEQLFYVLSKLLN